MELWFYLAILSAILFALKEVVSKKLLKKYDISATQLTFEQHLVAGLITLLFFLPFIDFFMFYDELYLFIGKSIFLTIVSILYLSLLKEFDISLVSPLLNLSPLFLLIFSTLFLNEKVTLIQILGILIIIMGVYILEVTKHHHLRKIPHKFHLKNLLSKPPIFFIKITILLICMSSIPVFDKAIFNSGINVYTNVYFSSLLVFIIISVYFIKKKYFKAVCRRIAREPKTLSIGLIAVADTFTILSAISLPGALVSLIVPIRRTSSLFSAFFGGILFHEQHLGKKLFAAGIILIGAILIIL
jgi:drug/metabolite transporter (DMT)-like permease